MKQRARARVTQRARPCRPSCGACWLAHFPSPSGRSCPLECMLSGDGAGGTDLPEVRAAGRLPIQVARRVLLNASYKCRQGTLFGYDEGDLRAGAANTRVQRHSIVCDSLVMPTYGGGAVHTLPIGRSNGGRSAYRSAHGEVRARQDQVRARGRYDLESRAPYCVAGTLSSPLREICSRTRADEANGG